MKAKWFAGFIGCAFAAVVFTFAGPRDEALARTNAILSATVAPECTGYCVICTSTGHVAGRPAMCEEPGICSSYDAAPGSGWHETICGGWNTCEDHECAASFADDEEERLDNKELFRRVSDAVRQQDGTALRLLVSGNPRRVAYVGARHAVQISACDGDVIAHYELSARLEAKLTE